MGKIKSCGRDCAGEVLTGVAVDAIIAYAHDKAADLIIISTHGAIASAILSACRIRSSD